MENTGNMKRFYAKPSTDVYNSINIESNDITFQSLSERTKRTINRKRRRTSSY